MHTVKFSYINPETQQAGKNFYTSEVSTNPTQPITFLYTNSAEEWSNRALRGRSIHLIGKKHKPEVSDLLQWSRLQGRAEQASQEQQQQRVLRGQIQELRKQLQQAHRQFAELVRSRAEISIKFSDSLHTAALSQKVLSNANFVCEQELRQLRDLLDSIQTDPIQ